MASDTPTSEQKLIVDDLPTFLRQRRAYIANRAAYPLDKLDAYLGQFIAWDLEGTQILVSAPTLEALYQRIEEEGFTTADCIIEGIPKEIPLF